MSQAVALDKPIITTCLKSSLLKSEGILKHASKIEISQSKHIKEKTSSHQ